MSLIFNSSLCVYSHSMRLLELANLLDLVHEVSSVYILHHKIQSVLAKTDEGGKEGEENEGSGINPSVATSAATSCVLPCFHVMWSP